MMALSFGFSTWDSSAITPDCFGKDHKIVRLFPDFREVELQYYRRTKVFHIMHTIVIKKDVHEKHPGLAQAFATAMQASKKMALERFLDCGSLQYMLPWLPRDVDEINEVFGGDPWPYGVTANLPTLNALNRHLAEQNIIRAPLPINSVFVPIKESQT